MIITRKFYVLFTISNAVGRISPNFTIYQHLLMDDVNFKGTIGAQVSVGGLRIGQ